jgi:hypothetical protein
MVATILGRSVPSRHWPPPAGPRVAIAREEQVGLDQGNRCHRPAAELLERATDLLLLFVGPDVYHALVDGRGWSHDEWVDWTVSAVAEQIFTGAAS